MQNVRILYRWLFEPIVMPLWVNVLLWISGIIAMSLWVEQLTAITEASFCFMDAVLWVDGLINYWHGGIVSGQMEGDRPPLSLWMGAWLLSFGYTEVQALQLVARVALSTVVATVSIGLLRKTSIVLTGLACWLVLSAPSFSKLMLWLNAEMLVNAFFVLHLFVGWYIIDVFRNDSSIWARRFSLVTMGLLAGWTVCAKEQGILLFPVSLFLMTILTLQKGRGWLKQIVQHVGWYTVGAVGPLAWYGVHFREQWTNGEKWRIFIDDLKIMWSQDSLSDQLNAPTTWGTFSSRFGHSNNWWDFFYSSSSSLLQEFLTPTVYALGLSFMTALIASIWNWFQTTEETVWKLEWRAGVWILGHLLPVLPLLVVPIFEPYHYSVMWAPVVILLAWTAQQWMHRWQWKGILSVIFIGFLAGEQSSFTRTIQLERERCIASRLIPVRMWMRNNATDGAILWVTDSLTPYDRSLYPHRAKPFSTYTTCSTLDYVATSGLSNQSSLFAAERERHPGTWTKVNAIVSINKEVWQVYRADCHHRSQFQ